MDVDSAPVNASGHSTTSQTSTSAPIGGPLSRVGYVYSPDMLVHYKRDDIQEKVEDEHVERPERLRRIMSVLKEQGLLPKMKELHIRPVLKHEALLVHSEDHWNKVMALESMVSTHSN